MTDPIEELTAAGNLYKDLRARTAEARAPLDELIIAARNEGASQQRLVELSGLSLASVEGVLRVHRARMIERSRAPR